MKKDKEWLKKEVSKNVLKYPVYYDEQDELLKKMVSYHEVITLIDQIDESQKPVIPQFVADWIESYRSRTLAELIHDAVYGDTKDVKAFRRWFHAEYGYETNYSEFLARVWLDGYEVGKEKKYQVIIRDGKYMRLYLCKRFSNVTIGTNDDYIENYPEVTHLTEKEIKDYDKRFWAFRKPVEELGK